MQHLIETDINNLKYWVQYDQGHDLPCSLTWESSSSVHSNSLESSQSTREVNNFKQSTNKEPKGLQKNPKTQTTEEFHTENKFFGRDPNSLERGPMRLVLAKDQRGGL